MVRRGIHSGAGLLVLCLLNAFPAAAFAADGALDSGDTAWMITATALVLFMTMPGLALFYGGLVRSQHVLSVLMHCMAIKKVIGLRVDAEAEQTGLDITSHGESAYEY